MLKKKEVIPSFFGEDLWVICHMQSLICKFLPCLWKYNFVDNICWLLGLLYFFDINSKTYDLRSYSIVIIMSFSFSDHTAGGKFTKLLLASFDKTYIFQRKVPFYKKKATFCVSYQEKLLTFIKKVLISKSQQYILPSAIFLSY